MEEGEDNQDGRLSARDKQLGLLGEFVKVTNGIAAFRRHRASQLFYEEVHLRGFLAGRFVPWRKM